MDFDREFPQTTAGYIVPMVTASISTISSLVVVNIIYKSVQKMSTTFHRLMAAMSFFDLIASISLLLVTLPMPKDDNSVIFSGPMLGNHQSCQVQGYLVSFGIGGSGALYGCLSWYYVLSLRLQVNSVRMRHVFEPIMFIYAAFVAFFMPSIFLSEDMINTDEHSAYCTIAFDPTKCDGDSCERHFGLYQDLLSIVGIGIVTNVCLITVAMSIIFRSLYLNQSKIKQLIKQTNDIIPYNNHATERFDDDNNPTHSKLMSDLRSNRRSMLQALLYILAYFLTWIFMMLRFYDSRYYKDVGASIFFPLQGLWNMIIFVYDKACLVHEGTDCKDWWKAIKIVIFHPNDIPTMVIIMNKHENPPDSDGVSAFMTDQESPLEVEADVLQHGLTDIIIPVTNNSLQSSVAGLNSFNPIDDNSIRDVENTQDNANDEASKRGFEENILLKRYPIFTESSKKKRRNGFDDVL